MNNVKSTGILKIKERIDSMKSLIKENIRSITARNLRERSRAVLASKDGSQLVEILIIILVVVIVGAVFLNLYQDSLEDIWDGLIDKIKSTFDI